MKTYVIKYTLKYNNHTHSFLFHDGEYFGDIVKVAQAARFPQKISYWRSEWKKYLKGVKNIQVYKLDYVPFEFLEDLNDIELKVYKYDDTAYLMRGGREKSPTSLCNKIMRLSYSQLIDILLNNMLIYFKPELSPIKKPQSNGNE